jgi:sugar phosphate permease
VSSDSADSPSQYTNADASSKRRPGELRVIWTVWLVYGSFYFCRTNLAVALPGIQSELGYDKTRMGIVLLSLKIAYAIGQFVNGQFSEHLSPRKMLALGMVGSACLNVAFGFGTALYFFLFVWALNGYAQSLGWTPCVRVIGNWVPIQRRGKAIGIVGTGYQVTAALTFLVSAFAVWLAGWRGVLWIPPVILLSSAAVMWLSLEEKPRNNGPQRDVGESHPRSEGRKPSFAETFRLTVSNPLLWLLALSLGMLNACRYGFIDWGVSHLVAVETAKAQRAEIEAALRRTDLTAQERQQLESLLELDLADDASQKEVKEAIDAGLLKEPKAAAKRGSVVKSAVKYAVLPIGAIFGSFLAGWATDRFFRSRRAPVILFLLILLGCLTLVYDSVVRTSFEGTLALLVLVGFCIYGPQVLLVGTAPADLAREGTSAAAAGFVNCLGYFGAAILGDLLTGYLATNHGWSVAIYFWAGWAFGAALMVAFLWNARGHEARRADAANA